MESKKSRTYQTYDSILNYLLSKVSGVACTDVFISALLLTTWLHPREIKKYLKYIFLAISWAVLTNGLAPPSPSSQEQKGLKDLPPILYRPCSRHALQCFLFLSFH